MTQQKKILKLVAQTTEESFRIQHALARHIEVDYGLDICATVQHIALVKTKIENPQFK